jgi:hypothetical protein
MRNNTETGHAKNVANFWKIITYAQKMGTTYQPSNPALGIEALQTLHRKSTEALDKVALARLQYENGTLERSNCFGRLNNLATRVLNTLASSGGISDGKLDDAKGLMDKLLGRRRGSPKSTAKTEGAKAEPTRTASVSQQSFDSKVQFFAQLVNLVADAPQYKPNEAELTVEKLRQYHEEMRNCNQKAVDGIQFWHLALNERNTLLYTGDNCLTNCALAFKTYLKAIGGVKSPAYKEVSGLKFIRYQG